MSKFIFKRRDVREHFRITDYGLDTLVKGGILSEPIKEKGRHPIWSARQIRAAEKKLLELDKPQPTSRPLSVRPLSEKQIARARAWRI